MYEIGFNYIYLHADDTVLFYSNKKNMSLLFLEDIGGKFAVISLEAAHGTYLGVST